jgi:FixJ family two-component response regulator
LREGAVAFLRKPFSDEEFLSAVRRAWQTGAQRVLRDAIGRHQPKVQ